MAIRQRGVVETLTRNEHCRPRARIRNSKKTVAKFTAPIELAEQLSALTFERTCDFRDMSGWT